MSGADGREQIVMTSLTWTQIRLAGVAHNNDYKTYQILTKKDYETL